MKKTAIVLSCFLLVAASAFAQHWEFERVDTGSIGRGLQIRSTGGLQYVGYIGGNGQMRIAHKDGIWLYEDVDKDLVQPLYNSGAALDFELAAGPMGELAVAGRDTAWRPLVARHTDTGWVAVWTHELLFPDPFAHVAWTPSGALVVGYSVSGGTAGCVIIERRIDSVWQADTAAFLDPPYNYACQLTLYGLSCGLYERPCMLYRYAYGLELGTKPPWWFYVVSTHPSGDTWAFHELAGGWGVYVYGYDVAMLQNGLPCCAYYAGGCLYCEQDSVWPERVPDAAVEVDALGRRQVAFVSSDSLLHLAFKDSQWHFIEVPGVNDALSCDLTLDEDGQPLIAFGRSDSSVWIAHGVDVVGTEETTNNERVTMNIGPTIVRGILFLSEAVGGERPAVGTCLLDISGRKVMELQPGENDVRNLAPGVYFVRRASGEGRMANSKVVIAE